MDFLTHHGAKYFSPLQSSLFLIKPRLEWTYQVFSRDEHFYNSNSGWQGRDGGAVTKLTLHIVCSFAARWQSGPCCLYVRTIVGTMQLDQSRGKRVAQWLCFHMFATMIDRTWIISRHFICKNSRQPYPMYIHFCTVKKNCFQQSEYKKDYFF